MRKPRVLLLRPPGSTPGRLEETTVVANIPVIDIVPLAAALEQVRESLGRCDYLVVTSPRAARILAPLIREVRRLQELGRLRVAAVGPKTRHELERQGVRVDKVPREYRGAALAKELLREKPRCVLLPRSEKALPELREALEDAGVEAVEVPLYRPVVLDDMAEAAATVADMFDYVVFTSPSIAEAFTRHYPRPRCPGFTPIAIGPTTARRLMELGYPQPLYPREYTMDGVAELIERIEAERRTRVGTVA